jgi:uncharacterized protein YcbK (DUF882 family)
MVALATAKTGSSQPARHRAPKPARSSAVVATSATTSKDPAASRSAFARLAPIRIFNINTRQHVTARLYDSAGRIDEAVAKQLDALMCDSRDRHHVRTTSINRRALQLVYRAAYHFQVQQVQVVSAYRQSKRHPQGGHAQGRAIDFRLVGVNASVLAAYLRTIPRLGVGVYTHPKTRFVHLDVDASPPRRHWRERNISTKTLAALDAQYSPSWDWPEGLSPPTSDP